MTSCHCIAGRTGKSAAIRLIGLLLLGAVSGCAATPQLKDPNAVIENRTGRTLQSILYRPCGIETADWQPLLTGKLASHDTVSVEFPLECLDFKALFEDGKLAGSQQKIRRRFPFHWILH